MDEIYQFSIVVGVIVAVAGLIICKKWYAKLITIIAGLILVALPVVKHFFYKS